MITLKGKTLIKTDITIKIPDGWCYGSIPSCTGLALIHHIETGADVLDLDYKGPLQVIIINHSSK